MFSSHCEGDTSTALAATGKQEFSRVAVLQDLQAGRVGVDEAAALLRVTRRQLFRLQKAFLADGPAGLASRRRGQPGNRRTPDPIRRQVLAILGSRAQWNRKGS